MVSRKISYKRGVWDGSGVPAADGGEWDGPAPDGSVLSNSLITVGPLSGEDSVIGDKGTTVAKLSTIEFDMDGTK